MNQKRKCTKCGLLIDDDLPYCPYCGYKQEKEEEIKDNNQSTYSTTESTINTKPKRRKFFDYDSQVLSISTWKSVVFFILGFIGLDLSSTFLSLFVKKINPYFVYTVDGSAFTNFSLYILFFGIFIALLASDIRKVTSLFKGGRKIAKGILFGVIIVGISIGLNLIINLISSALNIETSSNNSNQSSLNTIIKSYPILSLIVFGFLGPIVEEFTYRVGLFGFIRKHNKVLAFILTGVIFGLIHFDFTCFTSGSTAIATELLSLPSYIVAGLYFSFIYDKYGLQASIIAHCFNNVYSILNVILLLVLGQL